MFSEFKKRQKAQKTAAEKEEKKVTRALMKNCDGHACKQASTQNPLQDKVASIPAQWCLEWNTLCHVDHVPLALMNAMQYMSGHD